MQWLQKVFAFYINSSIHVSLAVCALAAVTVYEFDVIVDLNLFLVLFFMTVSGYNFVKYAKVAGLHHRSLTHALKLIQIFSVAAFVGSVYFGSQLALKTLLLITLFSLLTFLYAVPIFGKKSLRTLSGIKIFIVGIVWAGVTVLVPLFKEELAFTLDVWLVFVQRFLFVVTITLPFEIRDMGYDMRSLKTIPQRIGVKKTKILGVALLMTSLVLEGFKDAVSISVIGVYCGIVLLTLMLLFYSKEKQSRYFSSFWVEAIPMVWILGVILLKA